MFDDEGDWFTGKSKKSTSFIERKRKEFEASQAEAEYGAEAIKKASDKPQDNKKPGKSILRKVTDFVGDNVVKPTVATAEKAANTVAAGGVAVAGAADAISKSRKGDKKGSQEAAAKAQETVDKLLTSGLGGKGGYLTPEQAKSSGGGTEGLKENFLKPTAKATAEIAPLVVPVGRLGAAGKLGARVAGGAAENAAIGAGTSLLDQAAEGHVDLEKTAKDTAFSAAFGAAVPIAGAAGRKVASAVSKDAKVPKVAAPKEQPKDLNTAINQAIDEQAGKYDTGRIARIKSTVGDMVDPLRTLAKADTSYAKANGIKRTKLNADESLEDLARRSAVSEREAAGLFEQKTRTGQSAKDLVQKYDGDSELGKEFNNYTNAKFDLEFREKSGGKKAIQTNLPTEDLKKFVDNYELKNPDAIKDLETKKAINDMAVDYLVKTKVMTADEAKQIKTSYKNAVPLERVFPDDIARASMGGKNIGSISKQTVIQRLEGGSDIPLSNSFDTMLNRVYKSVSQGNRAKLAQKLLERAEQGHIPNANVVVTAGNKEARATLREQRQLVNKGVRVLNKKVQISNRQARRLQSELNKLNKEGLDVSLSQTADDTLAGKLVDPGVKATPAETKNIIRTLINEDPKNLQAIRDKIATRQPKLAAKLDQVSSMRQQIDSLKAVKTDLKDITAEFADDPTTGKQVISGVIDGQSYKVEVPPEVAKAVQGLDEEKLNGVLKAIALAKKPFEIAWTGIANPVFAGISTAFYDTPMSIINSPQGFKTLAPKAVIESLKSLKSSSEFQKKLAAEGARPYGGSGASSFIKPDAKSLAAQRNILTKVKYNSTHPEAALASLDVFGGKLANMTRTRVARAAYDAARKAGANEKQAMENAALAYRTIMPDFDTMSNLTRQINAVVPFYAASVAGTRSFGKALKRDPLGTSAKALTLGIAPTAAITAFSLMQPAGQEFYKDMEKSGNTQTVDNNMVVVLPGAHKDKTTGKWTGIIKVPLAPEFRAMNQSIWRGVRQASGGEGVDASHVALSIFDTITGGVRTSENPLITTQKILSGEDPRTGERIIKGNMADLPVEDQRYDTTSKAGDFASKVLRKVGFKGASPIQGDKVLGQFGLVGKTATNGGKPVEAVTENVGNRFNGASGERAASAFYDLYTPTKAKRDKASHEVTDLVKQGKLNEAKRRANEFNDTLPGKFSNFTDEYGDKDVFDPAWNDMLGGLAIKTSDTAFKARAK